MAGAQHPRAGRSPPPFPWGGGCSFFDGWLCEVQPDKQLARIGRRR